MVEYKCSQCGASFPSQEALQSHAKMKVSEESKHFAKMSHNGLDIKWPTEQEKPR